MVEVYKQLLKNAEEYLSASCYKGVVYSSKTNFKNVSTFSPDNYVCRVAADISMTAEEVFEEIMQGTDGAQFYMKHPDGSEVMHNSFRFACTITEEDGTSREFKGCWRDLKLDCYTSKLSKVKVINKIS